MISPLRGDQASARGEAIDEVDRGTPLLNQTVLKKPHTSPNTK